MVAFAKLTDIGGVTETALRGASVLVLEDELLLRKQVAAVLEQHEADVTAVGTVDEARRMIASLPFDFALLDVNLPDGLGTDLLSDGVFFPQHSPWLSAPPRAACRARSRQSVTAHRITCKSRSTPTCCR